MRDQASIRMTRNNWSNLFMINAIHVKELIDERDNGYPGEEQDKLTTEIEDNIHTCLLILYHAIDLELWPDLKEVWFNLKQGAGHFPSDNMVDLAKQLVEIHVD